MARSIEPRMYINQNTADDFKRKAEEGDPDAIAIVKGMEEGSVVIHSYGPVPS